MSYFEFEDVKRFHQPYEDQLIRGPYWKPGHDNSPWINVKRTLYPAALVAALYEPIRHFATGAKILNGYYEWPKTRMERNIFFREVFRLPNFWPDMLKKMSFKFVYLTGDVGLKMTAWRLMYGATSSPAEFADYNAFKIFFCALFAFIPTCWTAIPFEMASRAYYADKTWPVELRRNYRSPLNALIRIPFEEGPTYLFRGGMPIAIRDFFFYSFFSGFYAWLKNKMFFLYIYHEFSYNYVKFFNFAVSFAVGWLVAYPFHFSRELVDLWPKERGGHCTWGNQYNGAIRWMMDNLDILFTNFFPNFWTYMVRKGIPIAIMLWVLDNQGFYTNSSDTHLGLETQFPIFMESV